MLEAGPLVGVPGPAGGNPGPPPGAEGTAVAGPDGAGDGHNEGVVVLVDGGEPKFCKGAGAG